MAEEAEEIRAGMTETEMRSNLVRLFFGGNERLYE
jgi:hypothetical protein